MPDTLCKQFGGKITGFTLNPLADGDGYRTGFIRACEDARRFHEGRCKLFRANDFIEKDAYRSQPVGNAEIIFNSMFNLLHYDSLTPRSVMIGREKQDRNLGYGCAGCPGVHVRGTGSDGGRACHGGKPSFGTCISYRHMHHALFVKRLMEFYLRAAFDKTLSQTRQIAMAKYPAHFRD